MARQLVAQTTKRYQIFIYYTGITTRIALPIFVTIELYRDKEMYK